MKHPIRHLIAQHPLAVCIAAIIAWFGLLLLYGLIVGPEVTSG